MSFLGNPVPRPAAERAAIAADYRRDEAAAVAPLAERAALPPAAAERVAARAAELVQGIRARRTAFGGVDTFLAEYGLTSREGIALMCLAEALLRIPDAGTADRLIRDKIGSADWDRHLGRDAGPFVNASTWALMLTGRLVAPDRGAAERPRGVLDRLVARLGEPVIREALRHAMRIMGRQFVMGRTIAEALERGRPAEARGHRHSFDMLGEAARTHGDADRYLATYRKAIEAIGRQAVGGDLMARPGISVKLSALHPRFEAARRGDCVPVLATRLRALAQDARMTGISLCVDSEEAERLDLTLDVLEAVLADPALAGWGGLGLAVQAYQKRAAAVIEWLIAEARRLGRPLPVRLVKGAYWDSEIKRAQAAGLPDFPVFTRKAATDVSYLACARRLLEARPLIYPQFATHNAHAVAYILEQAGGWDGLEFQRLHGMGEPLYDQLVGAGRPVRVYAPVGSHEELLAYLVRRLLENGANSSFVNRLQDDRLPVEQIVADPVARVRALAEVRHPAISRPVDLFRPERANSAGVDLTDPLATGPLLERMEACAAAGWRAAPVVDGREPSGAARPAADPARLDRIVGHVVEAGEADAARALDAAHGAWRGWSARGGEVRAAILERMADALEADRAGLMALAVREAGKTLPDALAEVREAVDFCRYYAACARRDLAGPRPLPGPTGEANSLELRGRGVVLAISPWNFPLAIFTGQVAAALAAGNAVLAKPAEQTQLMAAEAVRHFHRAGVPVEVLHLLPGDGPRLAGPLLADPRLAGVAFTGSTATARAINRALAARDGAIVPLIAETGGQNAMIVDSTALPEQVVVDVVDSAFGSAGQRCSALRVLFVPDQTADRLLAMLRGYAETVTVGDPALLATDVGPVIDAEARARLEAHAARMDREARRLITVPLGADTGNGHFVAPRAYAIDRLDRLDGEVFGPILHVIRYSPDRLDRVLEAIEATGYGLTLGIHSRIEEQARSIHRRLAIGNTYVNRTMVGSVVGAQPFGGHGLSGTGPKAGGPHYLQRLAAEHVLSIDTTAAGGNASLVALADEDPPAAPGPADS